jgi:hypothetical protein
MRVFTRQFVVLTAVVVVLFMPALALPAITISSETVTASPGSTGFVQVLLTNDFGTSQTLSGFSVDLLLSGLGVLFTGIDDQTSPPYVFDGFGTGALTFDPFPNSGFIASDISFNPDGFVTLTPGQTVGLGRIAFAVDGTAAAGLRPITFVAGPTTQLVDSLNNPYADSDLSFSSGGIDVQSNNAVVPEPASAIVWVLVGSCGLLAAWTRSRR